MEGSCALEGKLEVKEVQGGEGARKKIPVTVLTGFLGSGKTTLLNYILTKNHGKRIAVIENEFGEVGVDDLLVKQKFNEDEEIFEMMNGCTNAWFVAISSASSNNWP